MNRILGRPFRGEARLAGGFQTVRPIALFGMDGNAIKSLAADERLIILQASFGTESGTGDKLEVFDDYMNDGNPGPMVAPGGGTLTTGGTIASGTVGLMRYSYYKSDGFETAMSSPVSITAGAGNTNSFQVTPPNAGAVPAGYAGVRVYRSDTTGGTGDGLVKDQTTGGVVNVTELTVLGPLAPNGDVGAGKRLFGGRVPGYGSVEEAYAVPLIGGLGRIPKIKGGLAVDTWMFCRGYIWRGSTALPF